MLTRTFAAATLAGVVALAPTAAMAADKYPAPANSLMCTKTTVKVGESLKCTIGGPNGHRGRLQVTSSGANVSIAGTVTSADKVFENNLVSFDVTVPEDAGTISIAAIIDGERVDEASVAVVAATDAGATGSTGSSTDALSGTGFENAGLAAGAGVLLVAGAATVFVAARRRQSQGA
ncbi:hypothetical protein [Demequina soli]|uniref:hypothetical protein n=1 Tax=Demequina soli TaxID=1638987 RepID=UPI0007848241|nr:hypothetical protein [Demequina soli]